jgi:hypothetical protein
MIMIKMITIIKNNNSPISQSQAKDPGTDPTATACTVPPFVIPMHSCDANIVYIG